MKPIAPGSLLKAAEGFLGPHDAPRLPSRRRERSWDLCFSHFQEHARPTEVMEASCLHLGYYLASWGMLRGSSFLFRETNLLHYVRVVEIVEKHNKYLRWWDVPDYLRPEAYEHFSCAWSELRSALLPEGGQGLTLLSKVMMGVWGCLPSFDTYFRATFRGLAENRTERGAWSRAGTEALRLLHEVHEQHGEEIEAVRSAYPVWSFTSSGTATRRMPSAKVLDIYGFYEGWKR